MKSTLHWRKCLKKKLQNDPQSLGNGLNISTPDAIAREKHCKKYSLFTEE